MKTGLLHKLWIALTAVIVLFTAYVVAGNLAVIIRTQRRIAALQREKSAYRKSIEADSTLIERLKYDEYLERYARERFGMQRPDEDVYIMK